MSIMNVFRMSEDLRISLGLVFMACLLSGCGSNGKNPTMEENAAKGEILFQSVGCTQCHSLSGETMYGPALNNILGTTIRVVQSGKEKSLTVDREYIHRSIEKPEYEKLLQFESRKMPRTELSEEQINQITDYLISINEQ